MSSKSTSTKKPRIAIVIPSGDMVHADFAMCLVRLVEHCTNVSSYGMAIINQKCSTIAHGRNLGTTAALKLNPTHLLFIDSDQTFPPHILPYLIRNNKDIVGASSVTRRPPIQWTARGFNGERLSFTNQKTGLVEVASMGFSFMLIKATVFDRVPPPWFETRYQDEHWYPVTGSPHPRLVSEDEWFCKSARNVGYDVYADADVSRQIGHLGVKEYVSKDTLPFT